MPDNEWLDMSEEEAIAATIQCINLNGDDTLPCMRCPGDGMGDGYCQAAWNITVNALKDISKYRNMEKRLAEHYGECDRLLEVVVDGLCEHPDIDIGTPIKSRLLTDEDVDRWEAYKSIGTVEECREAMEKQKPQKPEDSLKIKPVIDYNGAYVDADTTVYLLCPNCGEMVGIEDNCDRFCHECGQAIDNENLEGMEDENT